MTSLLSAMNEVAADEITELAAGAGPPEKIMPTRLMGELASATCPPLPAPAYTAPRPSTVGLSTVGWTSLKHRAPLLRQDASSARRAGVADRALHQELRQSAGVHRWIVDGDADHERGRAFARRAPS
jgi:hypothetical protein